MKILQVTPTYPPAWSYGGITKIAYEITKDFCKRRHEVDVWTSDALDLYSRVKNINLSTFRSGEKIHYFKNLSMALNRLINIHITPGIFIFANRELKNFDVVHLHGARTFQNFALYHFLKKYNIPYIFQAHGSLPRNLARKRLKWIFDFFIGDRILRDATKVIALSQTEVEQYMSMGVPNEKIAVIPNGLSLSNYVDLPPKGSFKKMFGIDEDEKMVLYLGRIHELKGIDFLVKAYAHLIKNMKYNNVVLVIAGPDNGYLGRLKQLVNYLKISNIVTFTGMLSEKEKISAYVESSIIVNVEPSNVFGLVPLEAAACSKPVIVSKGNAICETIHEGKFGFSVKYDDIFGLAKMMSILLNDDYLVKEMGKRGREYVFENFGWDKIIDKYELLYENIALAN